MAVEKVVISIKHNEVSKVKNILYNIFTNIPKIDVNYDEAGDGVELEFRIPSSTFERVLTKFYSNGINVLAINSQTKSILYGLRNSQIFSKGGNSDLNENGEIFETKFGNYEDVVSAVDKFVNRFGIRDKSKFNMLSKRLSEFIGILKKDGMIKKSKANDNIPILLQIASSEKLKSAYFITVMKEAGNAAIEICSIYPDYVGELIIISNDRRVPNIINLRAASKFAEATLENRDKYKKDITIAKKRINKKWLDNIYDVAGFELTKRENENLEKFKNI
ncbi:MAG: hypothetical protein GXO87_07955 [Chlorobi bacterium]|nr:hypothetical protein [Chlorobiota bacterium]